jgi:DNA-directed RNA polymerase specialized sigma24 family protein
MLRALLSGLGPSDDMASYLATSIRHAALAIGQRSARNRPTDDLHLLDRSILDREDAIDPDTVWALHQVWLGLPSRWCRILWATEVDGRKPAELAGELGLSANAVSALAHRARRGLRLAYSAAQAR